MNPLSIKLNDDNFRTWRREALGAIKERNLEKFINEADFGGRPNKFIKETSGDDAGKFSINEEYKTWEEQDQVLHVWLLVSMSPKLSIHMLKCDHAFEVWKKIEDHFPEETEREKLLDENDMVSQRLRSLADECVGLRNKYKAIKEEMVKKYGPESVAGRAGTSGSGSGSA